MTSRSSAVAKKPRALRRAVAPTAMTGEARSSRDRLLDAAEELFANGGYNGVAMRDIAEVADVNLGSIPYYFGTKENLFKAVLLRRVGPVQEERKARLESLLAEPGGMTIEAVLHALLEPVFRKSAEHRWFRKLAGRSATDPAPEVRRVMDEIYDARLLLSPRALRSLCQHVQDEEFFWRLTCVYGAMFYIQADTGRMEAIVGGKFDTSDPAAALKFVVPFLAAGFRAKGSKKPPRRR